MKFIKIKILYLIPANPFTVGLHLTEHIEYYRCLGHINPNHVENSVLIVNKVTRDPHFPIVAQVRHCMPVPSQKFEHTFYECI